MRLFVESSKCGLFSDLALICRIAHLCGQIADLGIQPASHPCLLSRSLRSCESLGDVIVAGQVFQCFSLDDQVGLSIGN